VPPWMTAADVAKHLRLSLRTVRAMTADGRLPSHTLGAGIVRYRVEEVDATLAPRETPSSS
jgi:excisionase family DNA binding protein